VLLGIIASHKALYSSSTVAKILAFSSIWRIDTHSYFIPYSETFHYSHTAIRHRDNNHEWAFTIITIYTFINATWVYCFVSLLLHHHYQRERAPAWVPSPRLISSWVHAVSWITNSQDGHAKASNAATHCIPGLYIKNTFQRWLLPRVAQMGFEFIQQINIFWCAH